MAEASPLPPFQTLPGAEEWAKLPLTQALLERIRWRAAGAEAKSREARALATHGCKSCGQENARKHIETAEREWGMKEGLEAVVNAINLAAGGPPAETTAPTEPAGPRVAVEG